MLSHNAMVRARKAIEWLYFGKCTITEHRKVKNPNKTTSFVDVVVLENQPCRLSFNSTSKANQTDTATSVTQETKVFIAPEIVIKPGSKLTITQNGQTTDYKASGKPALYSTHQEIDVELFEEWA